MHQRLEPTSTTRWPDLQTHYCPQCGMPAWVEWTDATPGTRTATLVKIRCFQRHWFLMPSDYVVSVASAA